GERCTVFSGVQDGLQEGIGVVGAGRGDGGRGGLVAALIARVARSGRLTWVTGLACVARVAMVRRRRPAGLPAPLRRECCGDVERLPDLAEADGIAAILVDKDRANGILGLLGAVVEHRSVGRGEALCVAVVGAGLGAVVILAVVLVMCVVLRVALAGKVD